MKCTLIFKLNIFIFIWRFTLKWKISKGMWERDKHNGKGGYFEEIFEKQL
jgi:hypothetical protein